MMKRIGIAVVALIGGMALGAGAMAGQVPAPKAYMIAQLTVQDAKKFAEYAPKVPAALAPYGGHYIVRGGALTPLEGMPPGQRIVVIEFPDVAAAKAFYYSKEYQAIAATRHEAATGPAFIVEGVAH